MPVDNLIAEVLEGELKNHRVRWVMRGKRRVLQIAVWNYDRVRKEWHDVPVEKEDEEKG